jgi:hypothetical protein
MDDRAASSGAMTSSPRLAGVGFGFKHMVCSPVVAWFYRERSVLEAVRGTGFEPADPYGTAS